MPVVHNETLDVTHLAVGFYENVHISINHDEISVATNDQHRHNWLTEEQ
jgi:hypothetical protein